MQKEQTGRKKEKKKKKEKEKKHSNTRRKYVYKKESAKPKFNRIVKLTKSKQAKGQQKDNRTNTFVK